MATQTLTSPFRHYRHLFLPLLRRIPPSPLLPILLRTTPVPFTSPFSSHKPSPFSIPVAGFQTHGMRLPGEVEVEEGSDGSGSEEDGVGRKSRNQKKREARRAVKWGMELAELSNSQIKKILRVVSADEEVYDALLLVKRLGHDVREGKRRQFSYIGRLLREVEPELMDALIQASKDNDNNKLQALYAQQNWSEEDSEEEESESEECKSCTDTANRWLEGLISKDSSITKEVYSLHSVDFDRQELRQLVRKIHINEAQPTEENDVESVALTRAKSSLLLFLQRLAKQMLSPS